MPQFDSEIWKWLLGASSVAFATVAGWVYKGVDKRMTTIERGAKADLMTAINAINQRHEDHVEQDTRRFTGIFNRLDEVAKATARIEGYMQAQRDRDQRH